MTREGLVFRILSICMFCMATGYLLAQSYVLAIVAAILFIFFGYLAILLGPPDTDPDDYPECPDPSEIDAIMEKTK